MRILGIETSCDETAAAVVEDGKKLLSNEVATSIELHKKFGGVVPEIAARSHIEYINPVIEKALEKSESTWENINAIAVTYGPGLGGSLLVGVLTARTLAILHNKPLYAVNHVEAHVYANFLTNTSLPGYKLPSKSPKFPLLALIVSGGHTQLVLFENYFKYQVLGKTLDDAVGEAYDKVAKILGLPYPGGPSVEKFAKKGDSKSIKLPKAKMHDKYDFSYSGLKTAVLRASQAIIGKDYSFPSYMLASELSDAQKADIAASFNHVAIETLVDKTKQACDEYGPKSLVIAGGVAASPELRRQISDRIALNVEYTDIKLCTDNGAMIATYGCFAHKNSLVAADPYTIDISPNIKM